MSIVSPRARLEGIHDRLSRLVYRRPSYAPTATRRLRQACRAHDTVSGSSTGLLLWNTKLANGQWITPFGVLAR